MNRQCEICGAEIQTSAGACKNCGMTYLAEGEPDLTSYNSPRWGRVLIDLSKLPSEERGEIFQCVKEVWNALEINTSQKLFPGQFSQLTVLSNKLELYGPYSSYLELEKRLHGPIGKSGLLAFSDLTVTEIHRIRDSYK